MTRFAKVHSKRLKKASRLVISRVCEECIIQMYRNVYKCAWLNRNKMSNVVKILVRRVMNSNYVSVQQRVK